MPLMPAGALPHTSGTAPITSEAYRIGKYPRPLRRGRRCCDGGVVRPRPHAKMLAFPGGDPGGEIRGSRGRAHRECTAGICRLRPIEATRELTGEISAAQRTRIYVA